MRGDRALALKQAGRFGAFGFRGGTLVANRTELHRARGFAFLAPMPLRAGQPLSHAAVIANKNFFSHAKIVSTRDAGLCQVVFANTVGRAS